MSAVSEEKKIAHYDAVVDQDTRVDPVPEVPAAGSINAARYLLQFSRARWKRRSIIKKLSVKIETYTYLLDGELGTLGKQVRSIGFACSELSVENAAIDEAESRRSRLDWECTELSQRAAEENARFEELESERQDKLNDVTSMAKKVEADIASLETRRRALRTDLRAYTRQSKEFDKQIKGCSTSGSRDQLDNNQLAMSDTWRTLHDQQAKLQSQIKQAQEAVESLQSPLDESRLRQQSLKMDVESARRSLSDAREGHRFKLAEIEAERGRKNRELELAQSEIDRRIVTLGTLVNLQRIDRSEFSEHYNRIDQLRAAIQARTKDLERLTAEREAYDRKSLIRGALVLTTAVVLFLTIVAIVTWFL